MRWLVNPRHYLAKKLPEFKTAAALTSDLVGIGFRLAAPTPAKEPNIEVTLVAASIEGIVREDLRVLALLADWISTHAERVNVDRLTKLVAALPHKTVRAFWAGVAHWHCSDPRMKKLLKVHPRQRVDLLPNGGSFLIQRDGEDERFVGSPFRVSAKTLRQRPSDILSPPELAMKHAAYRWRIVIGPTYRADMLALLENEPALKPHEIARRSYGSWPTAWAVKRDWATLR